jgi:HK97 family phage prohead protease
MKKVRCRALAEIRSSGQDGEEFVIRGVASAGNLDRKGTIIDQESLWKATKRYTTRTLFWNHDWNAAIGRVTDLSRGEDELLVEAYLGRDVDVPIALGFSGTTWNVDNIRKLIQQGIVNAFSIGFDADVQKNEEEEEGPPTLLVKDLMEISVVTVPANEKTTFSFARSMILDGPGKESRNTQLVEPVRFTLEEEKDEEDELMYLSAGLDALKESLRTL